MSRTPSFERISTKQRQIAVLARSAPGTALRTPAHHIDMEWLADPMLKGMLDKLCSRQGENRDGEKTGRKAASQLPADAGAQAGSGPEDIVPGVAGAIEPWHAANPDRVLLEKSVISRLLVRRSDCVDLFFLDPRTGRLDASGFLRIGAALVRVDLLYPDDYPESPPRVHIHGLESSRGSSAGGQSLTPDLIGRAWSQHCNGGHALVWAAEFLERSFQIVPAAGRR